MIIASDGGGGFHQPEDVSSEAQQRIESLGAAIGHCAVAKARRFGSLKRSYDIFIFAVKVSFGFDRFHQEKSGKEASGALHGMRSL